MDIAILSLALIVMVYWLIRAVSPLFAQSSDMVTLPQLYQPRQPEPEPEPDDIDLPESTFYVETDRGTVYTGFATPDPMATGGRWKKITYKDRLCLLWVTPEQVTMEKESWRLAMEDRDKFRAGFPAWLTTFADQKRIPTDQLPQLQQWAAFVVDSQGGNYSVRRVYSSLNACHHLPNGQYVPSQWRAHLFIVPMLAAMQAGGVISPQSGRHPRKLVNRAALF